MNVDFNTHKPRTTFLGGFCPSNDIADSLDNQARDYIKRAKNLQSKINDIKNGGFSQEWKDAKSNLDKILHEINVEQIKLNQEKQLAENLGIQHGLGLWCNEAVARRKSSENWLKNSVREYSNLEGQLKILKKQQNEGVDSMRRSYNEQIIVLQNIKEKTKQLHNKIEAYKAEREKQKAISKNENKVVINKAGFISKKNLPVVTGFIALAGAVIFVSNKNKSKKSKKNEKVKK